MNNIANSKFSKRSFIRAIFFLALIIWCSGFSILVLFPNSKFTYILLPFLKRDYGTVCHQIDAKTFYINGNRLLVCARCTGIYLGALVTSFISLFIITKFNIPIKYFIIALIPMVIDVVFSSIGLYHYSKILAFSTGILFGSIVFMYILHSIENHFLYNTRE